jgi:hypothetical protein
MGILEIIIISNVLTFIFLLYISYKLFKFSMIILNLEDTIQDCLDVLDERYKTMTEVLEIPVFFDSTEIRRVINDIRLSRDSLVVVANKLTETYGRKIENKKISSENETE